jgi:hypothetical protein
LADACALSRSSKIGAERIQPPRSSSESRNAASCPAFVHIRTSLPAITDDGFGSGGKIAEIKAMRTAVD